LSNAILPYRVWACTCAGVIRRCARRHVQPPPPGEAQAARAQRCVPFTRSWHCLCSPRCAGTPALLRTRMRPPCLDARVHGSALLRQAPRRCQVIPFVAPRGRVYKGSPYLLPAPHTASHFPLVSAASSPVLLPFRIIAVDSSLQSPPCLVCRPQRSSP
jgi:hypothetical protein